MTVRTDGNYLGLDVGTKRIGVALASGIAKLASPLTTIDQNDDSLAMIEQLCREHDIAVVVVGLPRSMNGADTPQTAYCRAFAHQLTGKIDGDIVLQDEALTSVQAEQELDGRGKPYAKAEVDALAASYILEDYIREHVL